MPAPKRPNTAAATRAAAERLRRLRIDAAAELLHGEGWTVTPPDCGPPAALADDDRARIEADETLLRKYDS